MISRLLLVALVGVLGISLPDGAGWSAASTTSVETSRATAIGHREAVAIKPIVVEDDPSIRFADELNRRSEGLDIVMLPATEVVTRIKRVATDVSPAIDRLFDENQVWDVPVDDVDRLFAENRVWSEPLAEPAAASVPPIRVPSSSVARIVPLDDATSLADLLNRRSEGIAAEPKTDVARDRVDSPSPHRADFEPIAVVETTSDLADELNRRAEGLAAHGAAEREVKSALVLTRDAALAWMNVLTRTATIASSLR